MISLLKAIDIVNSVKEKNKKIFGAAENDTDFLFFVETDDDIKDHDYLPIGNYVTSVNKNSGAVGSLDFFEYCDGIDDGRIQKISLPKLS